MTLRTLYLGAVLTVSAAVPMAGRQAASQPAAAPPPGVQGAAAAANAGSKGAATVPVVPSPPPSVPPAIAAAVGGGASVPDPGIVEVPFELASRTFKQVLPFDLPFHLAGVAPPGLARIELQYIGSTKAIVATKITPACGPSQIVVAGQKWAPDPPSTWAFSPLLDQPTPPNQVKFILTVPALDAQRYYIFKLLLVSTVTPDKSAGIQRAARSLFDKTLALVPEGSIRLPQVEQIRKNLIEDIKSQLAADQVVAPGSVFDPCLDNLDKPVADAVRDTFRKELQTVVDSQNGIVDSLGNLARGRELLRNALGEIADPLPGLLLRLNAMAKTDPFIDAVLKDNGGADLVTAQMPAAVRSALLGPDLPAATTSTAVASLNLTNLKQTYDGTADRLQSLAKWLAVLGKMPSKSATPFEKAVAEAVGDDRTTISKLLSRTGAVKRAIGAAQQLSGQVALVQDAVSKHEAVLDALSSQVAEKASEEITADATTTGNANTFQRYFVTMDLGLLYSWDVAKLVPYAGANIYFRPVNPNVPLSQKGGFGRRFSLTLGYTLQGIADNNELTRKDLFSGGSLVAGAGFRLTESIRFAAGALIFIRKSTNPLITDERVTASPYLSLSFDWKIAQTFATIGNKLFSSTPTQP